MFYKTLLSSVCAAAFITLTACGGGSGGNSGAVAVVPPPPSTNAAPVASVTVDKSSVDEGQSFTLDGTGSSDADGDALTYSWTQISGATLEGTFGASSNLELVVPELTETGAATFQLEVSDGIANNTARVDITFSNISQSPKADFELVETSTISVGDNVRFANQSGSEVRDFAEVSADGEVDFFQVDNIDSNIPVRQAGMETTISTSPEAFFFKVFGTVRVSDFPFLAADEAAGKVDVVKRPNRDGLYKSGGKFEIDAPCAIERGQQDQLIVGQRGIGLKLLTLEYANVDMFGDGEVVGARVEQDFSDGKSYCGFGYNINLDLLAVDYAGLDVSLFNITGPSTGDDFTLTFNQSVALDLPSGTENLEVVDTLDTGQGLLILLTDGQHDGSHHMVYVTFRNDSFIQKRYSWAKGVPSNMEFTKLFSDGTQGIVIGSTTSPEAIVFARPNGDFTDLTGPQYLEIGLGASEVVTARQLPRDDIGLLVTYPEKGEIRFLSPR